MDLPTYTNIWRIEKRLYKLYDFRLPAPLPITWIAIFAGITVPYVVFLVAIGLPFNHDLVWLYVLPPGVLTWLTTRPVIENKRLPELVSSQLRYMAEPRTWCRMAPFAEKDHIAVSARVWRRHPPQDRPEKAATSRGPSRRPAAARPVPGRPAAGASAPVSVPAASGAHAAAAAESPPVTPVTAMTPVSLPAQPAPEPAAVQAPMPQRATSPTAVRGTPSGRPWPGTTEPDAPAGDPRPAVARRSAWLIPPADRRQDSRALEVSHDPGPDPGDPGAVALGPPPWPPPTGTFPIPGAVPEPIPFPAAGPFPEAGAFPEVSAFPEVTAFPEATDVPESGPVREADPRRAPEPAVRPETGTAPDPVAAAAPSPVTPPAGEPPAGRPGRSVAARVAALFVDLDGDRPLPSVERALSGPGSGADASWNRRVKVVTGGQGPGQQDLQTLDRDRARQPLAGPRLITVLGCTSGAGQSTVAVMTGLVLASVRDIPVAALDLNPGDTSLAARIAPAASVTALLAGQVPDPADGTDSEARLPRGSRRARPGRGPTAARLDVIAGPPGTDGHVLDGRDYQRLAGLLAARYPLTLIDPAPSRLTRALSVADQLVLVAPASADAATALASTQQWLSANGYGEVAARAVTVINGVGRRASEDVLRAEAVARGRCRAIVRVPWDDQLSPGGHGGPGRHGGTGSPSQGGSGGPGGHGGTGSPAVSRGARGGIAPPGEALNQQTRLAYTALAGVLVSGLAASREAAVPGRGRGDHSD